MAGPRHWLGWGLGVLMRVWRRTCRIRYVDDPRSALREAGTPYVYALLHAHQLSALVANDEAPQRLAAMVSRSADGDILAPILEARGVHPVRGSSQKRGQDKGGMEAMDALRDQLEQRIAVLLAVDGPRGPRSYVRRGAVVLAQEVEGAVLLPVVLVPSRRFVVTGAWDRLQIPLPFSEVTVIFGEPRAPSDDDAIGTMRNHVQHVLNEMERVHDPDEAVYASERAKQSLERE
ncbi:MAG: DUF374 domain-containing protein [Myxococcota bacterium]